MSDLFVRQWLLLYQDTWISVDNRGVTEHTSHSSLHILVQESGSETTRLTEESFQCDFKGAGSRESVMLSNEKPYKEKKYLWCCCIDTLTVHGGEGKLSGAHEGQH